VYVPTLFPRASCAAAAPGTAVILLGDAGIGGECPRSPAGGCNFFPFLS